MCSCLRISQEVAAKLSARIAVISSLDRGYRMCFPGGIHTWLRAGTRGWWEVSVFHHVGLCTGMLKSPHDFVAGFLQSKWPKTDQGRICHVLESYTISSAVFLGHTGQLQFNVEWGEPHKDLNPRR